MAKVSPQKAIRRFCLTCQGGSSKRVEGCKDGTCLFFNHRLGNGPETPQRSTVQQIRQYCLMCSDNNRNEVRSCSAREDCDLWSFRFGCTPKTWTRVKRRVNQPRKLLLPGLN
ncbi:MAG: restriction endonuclease [Halodesulfovibrio sp.]|uniref:restriction endonuclease n=1 Tax=Halodesulfovibrio sp. TaxID=1912772 RepID=UPI00359D31FB